jgi:hypothetical protein
MDDSHFSYTTKLEKNKPGRCLSFAALFRFLSYCLLYSLDSSISESTHYTHALSGISGPILSTNA